MKPSQFCGNIIPSWLSRQPGADSKMEASFGLSPWKSGDHVGGAGHPPGKPVQTHHPHQFTNHYQQLLCQPCPRDCFPEFEVEIGQAETRKPFSNTPGVAVSPLPLNAGLIEYQPNNYDSNVTYSPHSMPPSSPSLPPSPPPPLPPPVSRAGLNVATQCSINNQNQCDPTTLCDPNNDSSSDNTKPLPTNLSALLSESTHLSFGSIKSRHLSGNINKVKYKFIITNPRINDISWIKKNPEDFKLVLSGL